MLLLVVEFVLLSVKAVTKAVARKRRQKMIKSGNKNLIPQIK
jgi:hypothetical protein